MKNLLFVSVLATTREKINYKTVAQLLVKFFS